MNPNPSSTSSAAGAPGVRGRRANLGIVGATGAVGRELIDLLRQRAFPVGPVVRLFAGPRSAGRILNIEIAGHGTRAIEVSALPSADDRAAMRAAFADLDFVFFSAGADISRRYAPLAAECGGAVVIDNSSAFRMDPTCPLVVPEVNADVLDEWTNRGRNRDGGGVGGIIANPNCSTILMLLAVNPLHQRWGVRRLVISTYQAVSGAGARGMQALEEETKAMLHAGGCEVSEETAPRQGNGQRALEGSAITAQFFREPCAFNVFSHDSRLDVESGYNVEERKMREESIRIWNDGGKTSGGLPSDADRTDGRPALRRRFSGGITATCVRVPVMRAHAESVNITLDEAVTVAEVRAALAAAPGVLLVDDRAANDFPTSRKASGQDAVLVGRIRGDWSQRVEGRPAEAPAAAGRSAEGDGTPEGGEAARYFGIDLFLAGDQIRKGAALNAIQIAELLLHRSSE